MRRALTRLGKWTAVVVVGVVALTLGVVIGAAGGDGDSVSGSVTSTVIRTEAADTVTETDTATETVTETVTEVRKKYVGAPNHGVRVNYADWEGLFKIGGAHVTSEYGTSKVIGTFRYLGGGDCDLGYTEIDATFYQDSEVVGTALTNYDNLSKGAVYPLELLGPDRAADTADLVVTDASCK